MELNQPTLALHSQRLMRPRLMRSRRCSSASNVPQPSLMRPMRQICYRSPARTPVPLFYPTLENFIVRRS